MDPNCQPSLVSAYSAVGVPSDHFVAVTSGVTGRSHVISTRDWCVLQHALVTTDPREVAAKSAASLHAVRPRHSLPWRSAAAATGLSDVGSEHGARPVTSTEVTSLIARFVALGLVVPLPSRTVSPTPSSNAIVCVVTADRPGALKRLLDELTVSADSAGRTIVIRVHDNSRSESAASANAALCRQRSTAAARVSYYGEEARRRLATHLTDSGVDKAIVRFALWGTAHPRIGANRNAALLTSVGHTLLLLDDDVVPRVWARRERRPGIVLSHRSRARTFDFGSSRSALFADLERTPRPIWDAHAEALSRTVTSLAETHGVSAVHWPMSPSSPSWGELMTAPGGKVRVSMHGIIGDSGMGWLRELLLLPDPDARALIADRTIYEATCASGELRATVSCTTLSPRGTGPTGGMGLDASSLLPPFVPSHRCEDVLFLDTLRSIDRQAVTATLAQAVEHWPVDDRTRSRSPIWYDTGIRGYNVLRSIVLAAGDGCRESSPDARLRGLGRAFSELGSADAADIRALIRRVWLHHVARWQEALDCALLQRAGDSEWWVRDARRFRDKILAETDAPDADLPRDFDEISGAPIDYWRLLLTSIGKLYDAWPTIWTCAAGWSRASCQKSGHL